MQKFHPFYLQLLLYDRKHFCSVLTDLSNLSFLFHQKFPLLSYDLKNVLTKQFPNVLQNRCSYKFPNIHKKIYVLKSLFNTVRGLKAYNFNKKETSTQGFSYEYHKIFKNSFFMKLLQWLLLETVKEFLI